MCGRIRFSGQPVLVGMPAKFCDAVDRRQYVREHGNLSSAHDGSGPGRVSEIVFLCSAIFSGWYVCAGHHVGARSMLLPRLRRAFCRKWVFVFKKNSDTHALGTILLESFLHI